MGASIAVTTKSALGLGGELGALTREGIAGHGLVALVGDGALNRIASQARAGLTGVDFGAGIAVVAERSIGLGRQGWTETRCQIAAHGFMALIGGRA